jgi:hypothetical protein
MGDHTHDCPVCGRPFRCRYFQDCSAPRQVICLACWRARRAGTPMPPLDTHEGSVLVGLLWYLYDEGPRVLADLLTPAPRGRTLQERYPPAPGAFVTSYSSVELTENWFLPAPRCGR